MSTPVPPLVPTSAMPLATDSDAAFDAKAFPALASLNPFGVSLEAIGAATVANANAALAAALGGDLPAITGQALKLLRVNAGETAAEFVDPATVVLAEAPELTQVQVENPASTVFGQVSGERLSQAGVVSFTAQEQQIGVGQTWQDVSGSRSASSTSYQNTSGKPISIGLALDNNSGALQMSSDNSTWVTVGSRSGTETNSISAVIPNGYYYRLTGTPSIQSWAELR